MKSLICVVLLLFTLATVSRGQIGSPLAPDTGTNNASGGNAFAQENDVTWNSLGKNENDSMPIGNGDLAANVWTESNGDIVLLLAKSDAWTETGQIVKLGRGRIKLSPN